MHLNAAGRSPVQHAGLLDNAGLLSEALGGPFNGAQMLIIKKTGVEVSLYPGP